MVQKKKTADTAQDKKIYTVTQLTRDIRAILEGAFSNIWVEGEVSNYTASSAGHVYFSLKDKNSLLNCVMFRSSASRVKFNVEDGMSVLCHGDISLYDKRGQYQLYVTGVEPLGKGALQLAFEQLKEKLAKEGLFDEENKKELPQVPSRVGVVTSPTGAAIRDILKVSRRRFPNIEMAICPVKVQGDEAAGEISRAIEELNEYNKYISADKSKGNPIDVMIVGRGGGSLEDLWPFNEEKVARAIYTSEIPVISAVGHEIDYTISDFVADFRAPTPSAAAEIAIPRKDELAGSISDSYDRLCSAVRVKVETLEKEVGNLRKSYVLRSPMNVFLQLRQQVDELLAKSVSGMTHYLELRRERLGAAAGKMNILSPLAVLDRGYSITFKDDSVVKSSGDLKAGDILRTRLSRGEVTSKVENLKKA